MKRGRRKLCGGDVCHLAWGDAFRVYCLHKLLKLCTVIVCSSSCVRMNDTSVKLFFFFWLRWVLVVAGGLLS